MQKGLPKTAKVGVRGRAVTIAPDTYFIAKRMENAGRLQPGQALMLAATLPKTKATKKGKTK